ncbi:MAG: thioesterase family protein [Comamonas sp.]
MSASSPATPARPSAQPRSSYPVFIPITTRWSDNDVYGHVNNVVYYSWFDTAVNAHLIAQGVLDFHGGDTIGLVVETQCNYFASVAYPQKVEAGIRVAKLGGSSVRYEVGIFAEGSDSSAAAGHFVHVYVDAATRRPKPLPEALRQVLLALQPAAAAAVA